MTTEQALLTLANEKQNENIILFHFLRMQTGQALLTLAIVASLFYQF